MAVGWESRNKILNNQTSKTGASPPGLLFMQSQYIVDDSSGLELAITAFCGVLKGRKTCD
jgi:hypothetical protein